MFTLNSSLIGRYPPSSKWRRIKFFYKFNFSDPNSVDVLVAICFSLNVLRSKLLFSCLRGRPKKMSESQTKAGNQKKIEKKFEFENLNSKFKN